MTLYQPIYRYRVSVPRSEDPTESTVMRPISGAAHGDFFSVATKTIPGYAIDLPGSETTNYLIVNPVSSWPTTELTLSVWARFDGTITTTGRAFVSYSDGTQHNQIILIADGTTGFLSFWLDGVAHTGTVNIADGGWHHILVRWRSSDGRKQAFVDGTLDINVTDQVGYSITGGGAFVIGQEQDALGGGFAANQAWPGPVTYIRVWDRYLENGALTNRQDLVLEWRFDEGTGTVLTDSSSGGNDGTKNGSAPWLQGGPLDFKGYLAEIPRGRRGELDVLRARLSTGRLTLRNIDKRVGTDPDDNLTRWVTAFTGSTTGRDRLRGNLVLVEESLDGGATWDAFYTGRIVGWTTDRTTVALTLRDLADDLNRRVFVGTPAALLTGSTLPYLIPLGLPIAYGGKLAIARLEVAYSSGSGKTRSIEVRNTSLGVNHPGNVVTKELTDGAEKAFVASSLEGYTLREQTRLTYTGAASGQFLIDAIVTRPGPRGKRIVSQFIVRELDSSDPDYLAFPGSDENATAAVLYAGPPTEGRPLYVNNKHPAEMLEDLLLGRYGRLDGNGDPLWTYPMDVAAFTTFKADLTFKTGRWTIESEESLSGWAEEQLGQAFGLGYRIDPNGHVTPVDLRVPTGLAPPTITQSDLVAVPAPVWENAGEPITEVRATWFTENTLQQQTIENKEDEIPALPTSRISQKDQILEIIELNALADLGDKVFAFEANGYRTFETELAFGTIRSAWNRRQLEARLQDILRVYARGANVAVFSTRRAASVSGANLCLPGDFRIVDVDELPDPSTNLRGGPRLMRCVSREEQGPAIRFKFLDSGINVTAGVPTYSTLALTTGDEQHAVTHTVAPNTDDDAIEIQYAITATSVSTRPAESSELWTYATTVFTTASTTRDTGQLPAGVRVWGRIRSIPRGAFSKIRQPSAWVFPSTPSVGYVDTSALAVPTGTSESNVTNEGALLAWSVGSATLPVEVLFGPDGGPLVSIAVLPAGSTQVPVGGLTQNTTYDWEVRHRDRNGSVGASAADTFTTLNVAGTPAPATGPPIILIGANERGIKGIDPDRFGDELITGVYLELRPTDATLGMVLEQSSVTAGSNVVEVARIEPGYATFVRLLPIDGVSYFFRTKHIGPNFDESASAFSAWSADATPSILPDGILEMAPYTGNAGINSAQPEALIAPVGTDKWGVLE